ncbi:hypothetical protein QJS10_CPA07g01372 [Acorus calamus]|uniref:Late embryogenesis abundant protein LEA-2 subgroup domain-containing protein n=1 Tax=Acorus calamus TaxID=4465 RepID=A0AAV9EIS7_ACOCL|nr:hypothetical protein QJS10_CPA07g01372 [Acorus calamus]
MEAKQSKSNPNHHHPPSPPPPPPPLHHHHHLPCILISLTLLLLLLSISLTLAFTIYRVRDPKTQVISARVTGAVPRVTLPSVHVELNITIHVDLLMHNPNRFSLHHDPGETLMYYRGVQVGEADVAAGRIPAGGSEGVRSRLTVEAERFAAPAGGGLGRLVMDVMEGEMVVTTATRIGGEVRLLLGLVRRRVVAVSDCTVVVGVVEMRVRRLECKRSQV